MDNDEMKEQLEAMQAQIEKLTAATERNAANANQQPAQLTRETVAGLKGKDLLENLDAAWKLSAEEGGQ